MFHVSIRLFIAVVVFASISGAFEAIAAERVALVIGNASYRNAAKLTNPTNDATDIAQALRRLNFDVVEGRDLDKRGMEEKVLEFNRKLDGAKFALFFYAGHGMQVGGKNHLVPIDAKLDRPGDLSFETIDVNQVLAQMEAEKRVNLVFLDACRDNPLARSFARSLGTRSSAVGHGLATIQSAVGTMIAYATQPDNVALDGEGRNSPFTTALLKHIATPGLEVRTMMTRVRADVLTSTREKQVPWDHSSLIGEVVLLPGGAPAAPAAQAAAGSKDSAEARLAEERRRWEIEARLAEETRRREQAEADANAARLALRKADDQQRAEQTAACPATFGKSGGGREFSCNCAPNAMSGTVWGTNVYTDDSSICAAARHAGVVAAGGGTVRLRAAPGQSRYPSSRRNGITTSSWDAWDGSFVFTSAVVAGGERSAQIHCPSDVKSYRGSGETVTCLCTSSEMSGSIWGTAIYTDDSPPCLAAVHAGIISRSGGQITFTMMGGRASYSGSTKNGVRTQSYGSWGGSFRLQ